MNSYIGGSMLKRTNITLILIILVFSLLMNGCSRDTSSPQTTGSSTVPISSGSVDKVSLKIGSLPRIFDMVLYAAQQEGIFSQNNLQVEIVPFRSVVERNTAFMAGQLDGFVDSMYEAINLNKNTINCKVVGHNLMPEMFKIVASPTSNITTPDQLEGQSIATSKSTIMEYALDTLLTVNGVKINASYTDVPNMPLRLEMLAQSKIPAAILTPPLSEQAIANGNKLILDDSKQQLAGPSLIFSIDALNNKSDGIKYFIQSWQQMVKLINADTDKYRPLLVSTAQVPEALASGYKVPVFPEVRLPSDQELVTLIEWMKLKEMVTSDIPYDSIVEKRYLQ
jgi:NitT/TauT family transport system substrate-binding protein